MTTDPLQPSRHVPTLFAVALVAAAWSATHANPAAPTTDSAATPWSPDSHDLTVLLAATGLVPGVPPVHDKSLVVAVSHAWVYLEATGYLRHSWYRDIRLLALADHWLAENADLAAALTAALAALIAGLPIADHYRHREYRELASERWRVEAAGGPTPLPLPGSPGLPARMTIIARAMTAARAAYKAAQPRPGSTGWPTGCRWPTATAATTGSGSPAAGCAPRLAPAGNWRRPN